MKFCEWCIVKERNTIKHELIVKKIWLEIVGTIIPVKSIKETIK